MTTMLVIGAGNMGAAVINGALRAGVLRTSETGVVEPDARKRAAFAERGLPAFAGVAEGCAWLRGGEPALGAGVVMLAVKPQVLPDVAVPLAEGLKDPGGNGRLVISVLAGVTAAQVQAASGGNARVVRVMPNLPAQVGAGATAITAGPGATADDLLFVRSLFAAVGPLVVGTPEKLMDAFTAVAGSGPAYVFYLAEAMERAAIEQGFDQATARSVVRQTIIGAAELLKAHPKTPGAWREAVTSKGGTTAAATAILDEQHVMAHIAAAIAAARKRGEELAAGG